MIIHLVASELTYSSMMMNTMVSIQNAAEDTAKARNSLLFLQLSLESIAVAKTRG